jgi:TonB family protein
MHKRLHPLFTDEYLSALDRAPPGDPRNDPGLVVLLQLVVDPTGALHEVRVAKPSGVQSFDADAVSAFSRAAPFAPPPPALRSPDGNAYVSWALFRDPVYGCSTMTTHPYIFEAPPKP